MKFTTPNHTQDRIVSVRVDDKLYVSNSIPFLLVVSESELDIDYSSYEEDFCSNIFGLNKAKKTTLLRGGRVLSMYMCCNIEINSSLTVEEERKYSNLTFKSYNEYYTQILQVLRSLQANASDKERKMPYGMVSTISRGYDAPAASALVHEIGCNSVITFNRPTKYASDCGTPIAQKIGYTDIIEGDGNLYLQNQELIEAEACASGDMGTAIIFTAYSEKYKNCLFFMGTRGDSLLERIHDNVNDDYDFNEGNGFTQSCSSFVENALKTNSIIVHVPLIGGDRWSDLAKISNSDEMKPYSIGDDYDRPISRRILEEKGVERKAFGQKKAGAGISYHFDTFARMKQKMSPTSFESLKQFKKQLKRNYWSTFCYAAKYYVNESPIYLNYIFSKIHLPFRFSTNQCGKMSSPLSSLLIFWGMDVMMKRYRQQLI